MGEDTLIKISECNSGDTRGTLPFNSTNTLQLHESATRALSIHEVQLERNDSEMNWDLFVGGGKEQLSMWRVTEDEQGNISAQVLLIARISDQFLPLFHPNMKWWDESGDTGHEVVSHETSDTQQPQKVQRQEVCHFYSKSVSIRKNVAKNATNRTHKQPINFRIMSLQSVQLSGHPGSYLIMTGGSDACIKFFIVTKVSSTGTTSIIPVACSYEHNGPVINLSVVNMSNDMHLLFSGATDGEVSVFDISDLVKKTDPSSLSAFRHASDQTPTHMYAVHKFQAHQSGINSLSARAVGSKRVCTLTGGDDQSVCYWEADICRISSGRVQISNDEQTVVSDIHCSCINGAKIVELPQSGTHLCLVTSIDQRLNVFVPMREADGSQLSLTLAASCMVEVSDISHLDAQLIEERQDGTGRILIAVSGAGITTLDFDLR